MSIIIKEYLSYNLYNKTGDGTHITEGVPAVVQNIPKDSVMVDIEGLHVGATRNFTRYMKQGMINSVPTWTKPYLKPLIMHHNEENGKTIGRIYHVEYTEKGPISGIGSLNFTTNIPDKEGKEQVEDGRLMTVSVGIVGRDVRCSICGHNIAKEGPCEEHLKGQSYDGEVCYWDIYEFEGKELSYVIVPSDMYARNIRVYRPDDNIDSSFYFKEKYGNEVDMMSNDKDPKEMKKDELLEAYQSLKEQLDNLNQEKSNLDTQIQEANQKIKDLEDQNEKSASNDSKAQELQTQLQEAQNSIKDLEQKIQSKDQELETKGSELQEQKNLKEAAENEAIKATEKARKELVEHYKLLRKLTNKSEVDEEKIKERTEESLRGAVLDLQEELDSGNFNIVAGSVEDPTPGPQNSGNVNKQAEPVNLQEELKGLFSNVASVYRI